MKKGWIIGILGCPAGACSGVSLTEQLKISKDVSIKNNRINRWEDIKLVGEKRLS